MVTFGRRGLLRFGGRAASGGLGLAADQGGGGAAGGFGLGRGFGGLVGDGGEAAHGAGLVGGEEGRGAGFVDLVDGGRGGAEGRRADDRAEVVGTDAVTPLDLGGVEVGVQEVTHEACLVFDRHAAKVEPDGGRCKRFGPMCAKRRTDAVVSGRLHAAVAAAC